MLLLRFWRFGQYKEVVIDDRLATVASLQLIFMNAYKSVFWQPLVEKSYAKFLNSYDAIYEVSWRDTYVDLSGGVAECYLLLEAPADLFQIMIQSLERSSTIITHCMARIDHHYIVTMVKTIQMDVHVKPLRIVGVSNLFTRQLSSNIPHIQNSYIWKFIPEKVQDEIQRGHTDNGEITMRYQTFLRYFDHIQFHHIPGEFATGDEKWLVTSYKGLVNHPTVINLEYADDHDQAAIVVSVMQANRSVLKDSYPRIKFEIYRLNHAEVAFPHRVNYKYKTPVGSHEFKFDRELCKRFKLKPGHYAIIPRCYITFTDFLIRVFSDALPDSKHQEVITYPEPLAQVPNKSIEMQQIMPIIKPTTEDCTLEIDAKHFKIVHRRVKMLNYFLKLLIFITVVIVVFIMFYQVWMKIATKK